MKIRIMALVLCLSLLLPCMALSAQQSAENVYDDTVMRKMTSVVYCLSDDRNRLVPDVRTVSIMNSETVLEVLAGEVLKPVKTGKIVSAMSERVLLYVISVMQTGRVATVDLGGEAEILEPYEMFCLKAAMANTLIETGQVDYVNVLFDGREMTTNDLPSGTLTRFDEDLQSAWIEHENEGLASLRSPDYTFQRYVTLYFTSGSSDFLQAEVRQVSFTRTNLVIPVISALISGPISDTALRRSYPSSASVMGIPSIEQEGTDTRYVDVNFSYEMGYAFTGDADERRLRLAPLVMTLTTFLPETDAVRVRVNRRPIESISGVDLSERLLYRSQFIGLLGRTVELYFPDNEGRQRLVTRAIPQKESTLRDLMEQLLIVPENVSAVFPEGFDASHIRGVTMMDDIAVVNLTQTGAQLLSGLTQEEERSCIFCIVNTLTSYAGVSRVQFLVEGCKVDSLAGTISLRSPLVRNPGVILTKPND